MKKDYFYNIDKSYKGNKNDIIYEKEIEEITLMMVLVIREK